MAALRMEIRPARFSDDPGDGRGPALRRSAGRLVRTRTDQEKAFPYRPELTGARAVPAMGPWLGMAETSTRRFACRPGAEVLSEIGR